MAQLPRLESRLILTFLSGDRLSDLFDRAFLNNSILNTSGPQHRHHNANNSMLTRTAQHSAFCLKTLIITSQTRSVSIAIRPFSSTYNKQDHLPALAFRIQLKALGLSVAVMLRQVPPASWNNGSIPLPFLCDL